MTEFVFRVAGASRQRRVEDPAARSAPWPLHETLGSKLVSSDNTFAISGIITSAGHLASPAASAARHILLSQSLSYFHGRHPEPTSGNGATLKSAVDFGFNAIPIFHQP